MATATSRAATARADIAQRLAALPSNQGPGASSLSLEEVSSLASAADLTRAASIIGASREAVTRTINRATERKALRFIGTYCYGMAPSELSATERQVKATNKEALRSVHAIDRENARTARRSDAANRLKNADYRIREALITAISANYPADFVADMAELLSASAA